jgi:hypothetical protein
VASCDTNDYFTISQAEKIGSRTVVREQLFAGQLFADNYSRGQLFVTQLFARTIIRGGRGQLFVADNWLTAHARAKSMTSNTAVNCESEINE